MIVLAGIPSEPPLARVADELERLGVPTLLLDQRDVRHTGVTLDLDRDGVRGELTGRLGRRRLQDVAAVYTRLTDDRRLPELVGSPAGSPARLASRELHDVFHQWLEITPARVVNRPSAMGSNGSKPYQAQLIGAAGFAVPETLVTNDPELVRAFLARHRRVVYKSASGTRSIVRELDAHDLARLDDVRWCPVQFQALVAGTDVRVHVVGRHWFATRVRSTATDYRYATGTPARLEPTGLDDPVAERCVSLTRSLGLRFAGIDLRLPDDGGPPVCFEVNPCPAYSYYEAHTGQRIAAAVARHLAGVDD